MNTSKEEPVTHIICQSVIPSLHEALKLAEIIGGTVILVCIFMIANNAALAASDAVNRKRRR